MGTPYGNDSPLQEEYNHDAGTYHVHNVWQDSQPISETVTRTIAAVTGTRYKDIGPMYEVVDSDALNTVFKPVSDAVPRDTGGVSFTLSGRNVTVYAHGEIVVTVHKPTNGGVLESR